MQEVIVTIENGEATITVKGVKGTACKLLTRPLEQALGGDVAETKSTPEAYENASNQIRH